MQMVGLLGNLQFLSQEFPDAPTNHSNLKMFTSCKWLLLNSNLTQLYQGKQQVAGGSIIKFVTQEAEAKAHLFFFWPVEADRQILIYFLSVKRWIPIELEGNTPITLLAFGKLSPQTKIILPRDSMHLLSWILGCRWRYCIPTQQSMMVTKEYNI